MLVGETPCRQLALQAWHEVQRAELNVLVVSQQQQDVWSRGNSATAGKDCQGGNEIIHDITHHLDLKGYVG